VAHSDVRVFLEIDTADHCAPAVLNTRPLIKNLHVLPSGTCDQQDACSSRYFPQLRMPPCCAAHAGSSRSGTPAISFASCAVTRLCCTRRYETTRTSTALQSSLLMWSCSKFVFCAACTKNLQLTRCHVPLTNTKPVRPYLHRRETSPSWNVCLFGLCVLQGHVPSHTTHKSYNHLGPSSSIDVK
jgi:hypothetical protein